MTGYIQRLLDRSPSLDMATPDMAMPDVRAVGRLTAPLIDHDQRLMTGDENLEDIAGFLDRDGADRPTRYALFDLQSRAPAQRSKTAVDAATPKVSPLVEAPTSLDPLPASEPRTPNRPPPEPTHFTQPDANTETPTKAYLPDIPSPLDRVIDTVREAKTQLPAESPEGQRPEKMKRKSVM